MTYRDQDPSRADARGAGNEGGVQPDPMLQTAGRSTTVRGWIVIIAAVVVLCLVLYGLNAQRPEQTAGGNTPAVTSSPAPAAGVPAPAPQTTTGQAPAPAAPQPSGQSHSGNQSQGEAPAQTAY